MSQENVERIRRAHEVANRGEPSAVSSEDVHRFLSEFLHLDVVWHDQRELPGATVHKGIEGVERHLAAAREALDYHTVDLLEIIDAGQRVVAAYCFRARGRSSGVPVERDAVYVYSFRGAKVERVEIFGTRREALEAVGRSEQTMSQENVEIVRRVHELYPSDLEAGLGRNLFDPDIEWLPASQSILAGNVYHGHEGVRRFWEDLLSAWDEYEVESEEFVDLGDQVVVVHRIRARSGRGIEVKETWSGLFTLRDGKVIRFQGFTDRNGALAAAGRRG